MPIFVRLGKLARKKSGVDLVLVSDRSTAETHEWVETIRREDGVQIDLPLLVAPRNTSDFLITYNPRGLTPYFCYIDAEGIVQTREHVGGPEWLRLKQRWEGASATRLPGRSLNRYC